MPIRCIVAVTAVVASAGWAVAAEMPSLPDALLVPKGQAILSVAASGTQNYECVLTPKGKLAWSFREPKAELSRDNVTIGRHYAGPTWEFSDGTKLVGQVVATAPGKTPDDIPWLKLTVRSGTRKGPAGGAKFILRADTQGGVLAGDCTTAKELRAQPYKATYVFVK